MFESFPFLYPIIPLPISFPPPPHSHPHPHPESISVQRHPSATSSPCQPRSPSAFRHTLPESVPRLICYSRSLHSNTVEHAARHTRIAQQTTSRHSCPTSCPSRDTCPQTRAHSGQRERESPVQPAAWPRRIRTSHVLVFITTTQPPPAFRVRSSLYISQ